MTLFRPEYSKSGQPCSAEAPLVEDTDLRLDLFDGVTFEDDPRAAPPRAFIRLPGPELRHTAGGTSAGSCADAGATYCRAPVERSRDEVRASVKRLFDTGASYGAIADQLGLTRHRVSGLCYRMGLMRGNEKMMAVAAAKRGE